MRRRFSTYNTLELPAQGILRAPLLDMIDNAIANMMLLLIAISCFTGSAYAQGSDFMQRATWMYKSKTPTHLLNRARAYMGDESRMVAFMAKAARGMHGGRAVACIDKHESDSLS